MPLFILIKSRQRKKKYIKEHNVQLQPSSPSLPPQIHNNHSSTTTENSKEMPIDNSEPTRLSKMFSGAAARLSKKARNLPTFWKKNKDEVVNVTVATTTAVATAFVTVAAEENRILVNEEDKEKKDKEPLKTRMKLVLLPSSPPPPQPPSPTKTKSNSLQIDLKLSIQIKAVDFPQRCRYDPRTDEYVPVHLWKPQQLHDQPIFEISEVMSPIREELRGFVENATIRAEEERTRLEERRISLHRDMETQFLKVESQIMEILEDLCGDHDDNDDVTSVYSRLEDDIKPLPHRDSGISMGGSSSVEDRPRDGAEEYWSSVRDSVRLLDDEEIMYRQQQPNEFFPQSKMRAKTWSPRARWEYSLGNRLSDTPGDWRHVLWVSPSLKEQLVRRQTLSGAIESESS